MICKFPTRRALWHDSSNYRVYVHQNGAVEIERLHDRAVALLPTEPAYTFACRAAILQRSHAGVLSSAALDRLCGDFDHIIDRAAESRLPPRGVVLQLLHARVS